VNSIPQYCFGNNPKSGKKPEVNMWGTSKSPNAYILVYDREIKDKLKFVYKTKEE